MNEAVEACPCSLTAVLNHVSPMMYDVVQCSMM
jgi:hypothetical protein